MHYSRSLSPLQTTFFQQQYFNSNLPSTPPHSAAEKDWTQFWQEYRDLELHGFIEPTYNSPNPTLTSYSNSLSSSHRTQPGSSTASLTSSSSSKPLSFTCTFCPRTFEKMHLLSYVFASSPSFFFPDIPQLNIVDLFRSHLKYHTKPIPCPICPKHFPKNKDRDRHLVTNHPDHEITQPLLVRSNFLCSVSGCVHGQMEKGFNREDNLKRHIRTVHRRERRDMG